MNNTHIFNGKINASKETAEKLPVLTFSLGRFQDLTLVPNVVITNKNGEKLIVTKEAPTGAAYKPDDIVVVRIIGGKVLMNGLYDIYALSPDAASKKLQNEIVVDDALNKNQLLDLEKIFEAASEVKGYLTPKEIRNILVIGEETYCYNEWDPETQCLLHKGDVFVVNNPETMQGYRIGKDEFEGTHRIL